MLSVMQIVQGVGGRSSPGLERFPVRGAVVDSRLAGPADLFVAIKGERSDGHAYVADAFARGAVAALIERDLEIPGANMVDARAGAFPRDVGGPPFLIRSTTPSTRFNPPARRGGPSFRLAWLA
jgi:UDP-N-acetylmuramoyl-tripeptide--D-alanyl-D-alanine ligase